LQLVLESPAGDRKDIFTVLPCYLYAWRSICKGEQLDVTRAGR